MKTQQDIARWCAAALLVTADGRYLMQRRDAKPTILLPDHWALFGGTIDQGEAPEAALRRELMEELEFPAGTVTAFSEMIVELPLNPRRFDRMSFFEVPVDERAIDAMVLHEGAEKRLFALPALAVELRVAPWDLAAVMMHARRGALFAR